MAGWCHLVGAVAPEATRGATASSASFQWQQETRFCSQLCLLLPWNNTPRTGAAPTAIKFPSTSSKESQLGCRTMAIIATQWINPGQSGPIWADPADSRWFHRTVRIRRSHSKSQRSQFGAEEERKRRGRSQRKRGEEPEEGDHFTATYTNHKS